MSINLKRNSWGFLGPQRDEIVIFFQNTLHVDANIFGIRFSIITWVQDKVLGS